MSREFARLMLFIGLLGAMMTLRAWWTVYTSLLPCALFWAVALLWTTAGRLLYLLPGLSCNAAATLANGGHMPVFGAPAVGGIWTQGGPDAALPLLCDRLWMQMSVGDVLLTIGLVVAVVVFSAPYLRRRAARRDDTVSRSA